MLVLPRQELNQVATEEVAVKGAQPLPINCARDRVEIAEPLHGCPHKPPGGKLHFCWILQPHRSAEGPAGEPALAGRRRTLGVRLGIWIGWGLSYDKGMR